MCERGKAPWNRFEIKVVWRHTSKYKVEEMWFNESLNEQAI
jgi:hypothetical protein